MSKIFVHGIGAVSPAGWGIEPLRQALTNGAPLPAKPLPRPGQNTPLQIRQVPPPAKRPDFLTHARLRRTSPITHHVVASALEALGPDAAHVAAGNLRLGIVLCVMSGCVNYSRRFYDEVLRDPSTASPLVFPETVFNAPSSHIASVLGTPAMNYTLVGDPGTFLQGVALAAQWLTENQVDAVLVIGAEEADWLTSSAYHLFSHNAILSDGAGALYLKKWTNMNGDDHEKNSPSISPIEPLNSLVGRASPRASVGSTLAPSPPSGERAGVRGQSPDKLHGEALNAQSNAPPGALAELHSITDSHLFLQNQTRTQAAARARAQLFPCQPNHLLSDGLQNLPPLDAPEAAAWRGWTSPRISPKTILGEGLMAAAAWQCVIAIDALRENRCTAANVSIVGCNQQAIAAQFRTA